MTNLFFYKYISAAALFLSCCFVCGCENSQEEIDSYMKQEAQREDAYQVESYMSTAGLMKAKLTAPLMHRLPDPPSYVEFPNSLHVDFYTDSNKIETRLDAKYGKYYESENKVYLRDSVVIVTMKGDTLRCHDMWWDQGRGLFYTDTTATYRAPGNNITGGRGMEATQDLKTVTFKHPLGDLQIKDNGFTE